MSYEDKDDDQGLVLGILAGIFALVIGGVIALCGWVSADGANADANKANVPAVVAPVAAVAGAAAGAVSGAADEAKVVVENGVVKFYFASGKADLATGGNEALAEVVKGVKEGQKAVISGFHDSTGNQAANEELAKKRAVSVHDALVALGVPADKIEMKKPENAMGGGTGSNAEARRVEVVLAK